MTSYDIPSTSGIYRITCTANQRTYIGSAKSLKKRHNEHICALRHSRHKNKKLQNAWNKYGEQSFVFEVIELVLIPELLTTREQHWIDRENPFFNIARIAGSTLGVTPSPETCKKIGDAQRGKSAPNRGKKHSPEQIERHRQSLTGYKHTEEARRNMAESHRGTKRNLETRQKMRVAHLEREVSEETRAKIGNANRGKARSAEVRTKMGKISKERSRPLEEYTSRRKLPIAIVTAPDGTEYTVKFFNIFCKEHHLDYSSLKRVAQGQYQQHKGWTARFIEKSAN